MQRTGHGERETDVRRKGTFIRYVDQVSPEARSKQSSQEVHSQIDPSTASSNRVRSHDALQRLSGQLELPVHVVERPSRPGILIYPPIRLFAERTLCAIRADGYFKK